MLCPACQHENPEAAKFCGSCGGSLSRTIACSACNAENPRSNTEKQSETDDEVNPVSESMSSLSTGSQELKDLRGLHPEMSLEQAEWYLNIASQHRARNNVSYASTAYENDEREVGHSNTQNEFRKAFEKYRRRKRKD